MSIKLVTRLPENVPQGVIAALYRDSLPLAPCVRLVRPPAMTPTSFLSTSMAVPAIPAQTPSPITTTPPLPTPPPLILLLRMVVPCQPSNNRLSQRSHPGSNQHIAHQPSKRNKVGSVARRGKAASGLVQTTYERYLGQTRGMLREGLHVHSILKNTMLEPIRCGCLLRDSYPIRLASW